MFGKDERINWLNIKNVKITRLTSYVRSALVEVMTVSFLDMKKYIAPGEAAWRGVVWRGVLLTPLP